MPGELTMEQPPVPYPFEPAPRRGRARLRALLRSCIEATAVLVVFAVAGALAGAVWFWLWEPPTGVAYQGSFVLDEQGITAGFAGTGLYVVLGSLVALTLGAVLTLALERDELLTLLVVVAGSFLAAWVMKEVGHALGPPDPGTLAPGLPDLEPLQDDLRVEGATLHTKWGELTAFTSTMLAWPFGAVTGVVVVLFGFTGRKDHRFRG